jgi:hypothetical protein
MTTPSLRILAIESGYRNTTHYANPIQRGLVIQADPAVTAMGVFSPGGESSGTTSFDTTTYLTSPTGGDKLMYYDGFSANPVSTDVDSVTPLGGSLAQNNTVVISAPGLVYTINPGQLAMFISNTATTTIRKLGKVYAPIDPTQCSVIPFGGTEQPDVFNFAAGDVITYTLADESTGTTTVFAASPNGSDNGFNIQNVSFNPFITLTVGDYISIIEPTDRTVPSVYILNRRLPQLIN